MPSLTETLELIISADAKGAIAEVGRFSKEADTAISTTQSKLKSFGSNALKLGVGGLGVGGFLTQMASGDIEAANQLDAAIQQVGQSASDFKGRINDAVDAQVKFGHTDEEVSGALTSLTIAYGDTGKALDEMQLVADLAARKHISLGDAATAVAKAHGGAGRLFKEFGIQVAQNADGTKNYDGALTELSQKLTGQASAAADSWGGKLRELGARAENIASEFGQNFGPMILGVSAGMTALGGVTSGVSSILGRLSASHAAAAAGAEAQAVAEAEAAAAEAALTANSSAAVASLYAVGAAEDVALGPLGLLVIGLSAAAIAYEGVTHATSANVDMQKVARFSYDDLTKNLKLLTIVGQESYGSMQNFGKAMADTSIPQANRFADALDRNGQSSADFRAGIDESITGQKQFAQDTKDSATEIEAQTVKAETASETFKRLRDNIKLTDDAQKELTRTLKGETDPFFALVTATDAQARAQGDVVQKTNDLNTAIMLHGENSAEALTAQAALNQANLDAVQATSGLTTAQMELEQAVANGSTSVDNARWILQNWVNEGLITQDQADQVIGRFDTLKGKADDLNGTNIAMAVSLDATQAEATLKRLLDESGSFAALARETANTPGLSISGNVTATVAPPPPFGGPRASGGDVFPGHEYLVGEKGPEVLRMGASGGHIASNSALGMGGWHFHEGAFQIVQGPREDASTAIPRALTELRFLLVG